MENIEWLVNQKIAEADLMSIFQSAELRDDFICEYPYFHNDGHKGIYESWIKKHLDSSMNIDLEHVFDVANFAGIVFKELIDKAGQVLSGRYVELTKLACLNFLISMRNQIESKLLIQLSQASIKHTANEIVKFQAYINLLGLNQLDYLHLVYKTLKKASYPTLYYRLISQFDLIDRNLKNILSDYIRTNMEHNDFDSRVKEELLKKLG